MIETAGLVFVVVLLPLATAIAVLLLFAEVNRG